jgi:hypothetical protein
MSRTGASAKKAHDAAALEHCPKHEMRNKASCKMEMELERNIMVVFCLLRSDSNGRHKWMENVTFGIVEL